MPTRVDSCRAFSLIEVIAVALVAGVLAFLVVARVNPARTKRIGCVNNLKIIGLSFKTFALDNGDKYPFELPASSGGTLDLVSSGAISPHFAVMSNELCTPKLLTCPQDSRTNANVFGPLTSVPKGSVPLKDFHISYFINVDASDTNAPPTRVLAGDRYLGTNGQRFSPGLHAVTTQSKPVWVKGWHGGGGNVLMNNGSVQQVSSASLSGTFKLGGLATNRIIVP